jgi:hypothetical protein
MQKRITVLLDDQEKDIPGQMGCERYLATNNQVLIFLFFQRWGLNSVPHTCWAGTRTA